MGPLKGSKTPKVAKMTKIILGSGNGGAIDLRFHFSNQVFPYPPPKSLKPGYSDLKSGLSDPKFDFSDPLSGLLDPKSGLLDPK